MARIGRENNFLYLCLALVVTLFTSAVTSQVSNEAVDALFSGVTVLMLVVGVKSLHQRHR